MLLPAISAERRQACTAYFHALDVVQGRSSENEASILTQPDVFAWYAMNVLKTAWLEGILQSPFWAVWYIEDCRKSRWSDAESRILTDYAATYWYVVRVVKGYWKEAESLLKNHDFWSYHYFEWRREHVQQYLKKTLKGKAPKTWPSNWGKEWIELAKALLISAPKFGNHQS